MNGEKDPSFTPAQHEALEKAYDILGEHFEGFIIGARTESANPDDDQDNPPEARKFFYFGGHCQALGLAASMQSHLLENQSHA